MSTNNSGSSAGYTGNWVTVPTGNGFTITLGGWGGGGAVPNVPAKAKKSDGCNCKKCKEFYPYAEPNQDDGTLVCYSCRHGW